MTTDQTAATPTPAPKPPTIADPGPLGLAAFALSTFVLSLYNAGILEGGKPVVVGLAMFYGGLAQLLAGMWEFRTGNTFGALAFTSYGSFWLAWAAWFVWGCNNVADVHQSDQAIGIFLIAWGLFTAYMTVAATRTTTAILTVFALLTVTFFLLGFGDFVENTTLVKAGGVVGLATALAAWYGSCAGVVNSTFGKTVLPVGPRSQG